MQEPATVQEKLAALGPNLTANEAFDAVDTDQSGTISRAEFAPVFEHGRQQEREKTKALAENKMLKWMCALLILAVLIVIGVTSGVSACAAPLDPTTASSPPTPQPLPS